MTWVNGWCTLLYSLVNNDNVAKSNRQMQLMSRTEYTNEQACLQLGSRKRRGLWPQIAWRVFRIKMILLWCKNALAMYYNAGVVTVNSKVVGLAQGQDHFLQKTTLSNWTRLKGCLHEHDFRVGCDSRIRHCIKDRINPIFCAAPDAAVASDTENHGSCKQTFKKMNWGGALSSIAAVPKLGRSVIETFFTSCTNELA
jgi:hypothetical protein